MHVGVLSLQNAVGIFYNPVSIFCTLLASGNQKMEVHTAAVTLISAALIVLTGHKNGFVSAGTLSTVSFTSTTVTQSLTTGEPTSPNGLDSASTQTIGPTTNTEHSTTTVTGSTTSTTQFTTVTRESTTSTTQSTTATPRSAEPTIYVNGSTTTANTNTVPSIADQFHVTMIVMIVVLGFIIVFSVSCGLCVIFGIDVGCPIPCCGAGGKAKNEAVSASGIKLKRSSRPDRMSSHRLNEAEEFQEVEFKGFKNQTSAFGQENPVFEFY